MVRLWVPPLCLLTLSLNETVSRDDSFFVPQYAMRKDHQHIAMSDWDFRLVCCDGPNYVVVGFDYKASDLKGMPYNAPETVSSVLTMSL